MENVPYRSLRGQHPARSQQEQIDGNRCTILSVKDRESEVRAGIGQECLAIPTLPLELEQGQLFDPEVY